MEEKIVNKVTESGIITINLEDYYHPGERIVYDLKANLYQELILREKDFREFIKSNNWSFYTNKNVALICTADAIIPTWAFMLLVSKIAPFANLVVVGSLEQLENALFESALSKINLLQYTGAKVVVKGCGQVPVPTFAYGEITRLLLPVVSSLMFGEPCSTVPVFKIAKSK